MRRAAVLASVLLLVLVVSEARLADLSVRRSRDDNPPLWQPVVLHRAPLRNCVFVTSADLHNPYTLTSIDEGVRFDIDDDGTPERVSWTSAASGVAFLALDGDDDGRITGSRELIGEHTLPDAHDAPDALMALAAEAEGTEQSAVLDGDNPLFLRLLLWTDANHNGISEAAELRPIRDVLAAIGLGFAGYHRVDAHGNQARFRGNVYVRTAPGLNRVTPDDERERRRQLYEVCLGAREGAG
jgi:hypothetical protein